MYQCRGFSWKARGDRASSVGQWGWASFVERMDTCTSGAQRKGDRTIGPSDYISCGETSEKVSCSIGSAWVGVGAALDERDHGEVWGGSKREWMGTRSVSLWGPGSPVLSRRIARKVSSLIWAVLGERPAAAGENRLQEGEVHRKRVLDGSAWLKVSAWWFSVFSKSPSMPKYLKNVTNELPCFSVVW